MAKSDLIFRLIGEDKTGPAFASAARNASDLDGKVRDVDGSMAKLSRWGKAGALALGTGFVVAGAAAAKFGVSAAMAASDFGEVGAAIEQTFGGAAAADLQAWAKTSATALGQSKTQAIDAAKTFGVFGRAAGLTGTDLSGFATDLTGLATDLASFNNSTPEAAIEAIGAGLRGESEPLRQFGVLLDDATLKARAMQMGIFDGTGALTQQQRVLAAQAEIMAQTTLQQGDFARTQGGMANQLRETSAQWENIKIAAGAALVPIAERYLPQLNDAMAGMAAWIETHIPEIQAKFGEFVGLVESKFPVVQAQVVEIAGAVRDNWPEIKQTAEDIGTALQRVAQFSQGVWDAFQSLPQPVRDTLLLAAVAQRTGVLAISFKAADIVASLFKSTVPVMNVGTLNAAVSSGGAPGAAGTASKIAGVGAAAALVGGGIAATKLVEWSTEGLSRSTSAANVYASAVEGAAKAANTTAGANNGMGAAAVAAGTSMTEAGYRAQALAGNLSLAGTNAGLSSAAISVMSTAAYNIPPGASADQLAAALRAAGEKAGLSAQEIDTMSAAAYAIPSQASLPALQSAITTAGQAAGATEGEILAMSAAVAAVPPGATAAEMGEAIRIAGVKAGATDEEIQNVIASVNAIPPEANTDVTADTSQANMAMDAITAKFNEWSGKSVPVTVVTDFVTNFNPAAGVGFSSGAGSGGVFSRPLAGYTISDVFGSRGGTHMGIDLAAAMGTPITAPAPGFVTQAGWNDGYGNFTVIDHGGGMVSTYGHQSGLLVSAGQTVAGGQPIGLVGSTGDSTGPHLHFEMMQNGSYIDPASVIGFRRGGDIPVRVSNGEWWVPPAKAKQLMPALSLINAGMISGPGSGTSDSIGAMAPPGGFVVNAAATRRNRTLLHTLTSGRVPARLATGGPVGASAGRGAYVAPGTTVQLLIDGRALHESLIRYQRESGTVDLFPART